MYFNKIILVSKSDADLDLAMNHSFLKNETNV